MKASLRSLFVAGLFTGLSFAASSVNAQTDEAMPPEPNMESPEQEIDPGDEGTMEMPPDEEMELRPDEMMPEDGAPDNIPPDEMPPE